MSDSKKNAASSSPAPSSGSSDTSVATTPAANARAVEKNAALFTVREADLPAQIGVSRELIRMVRTSVLVEGVDWMQVHRDVMLRPESVEVLKHKLGCLQPAELREQMKAGEIEEKPAVAPENAPPAQPGPVLTELVVMRANFRNVRVITARLPDADPVKAESIVNVVVRDNALFRPGMKIQARQVGPKQFEFFGRYPKKPIGVTLAEAAKAALSGGAK